MCLCRGRGDVLRLAHRCGQGVVRKVCPLPSRVQGVCPCGSDPGVGRARCPYKPVAPHCPPLQLTKP